MSTANTQWFHIFRHMIESGDLASLSGAAVKVYLVVKGECEFNAPSSSPTIKTIMAKSGCQSAACVKALRDLEGKGYVKRFRDGRTVRYSITEQFRRGDEVVSFDYCPAIVREATQEVGEYFKTGKSSGCQFIRVDKIEQHITIINIFQDSVQIGQDFFTGMSDVKQKLANDLAQKMARKEISAWEAVKILKETE